MQNKYENYKDYCDGFLSKDKQFSFLLLYLRDNLFKLKKTNSIGLLTLCDTMIELDYYLANEDILTDIIENFITTFKHLDLNINTKLVNENKLMPISKAKKLNSYSVNWLSRKPGNSVKQKLSTTNNKIMAGRRYHSFDTLENQLFKTVCLKLEEYISYKINRLPKQNISELEISFYHSLLRAKNSEYFKSISRYQNAVPNNYLLTDRYYKNVRLTWLKLNDIDNRITYDISFIEREISIIFFISLIQKLSKKYRFSQEIILINKDDFDIDLFRDTINFISFDTKNNYNINSITLKENVITLSVLDDIFNITFCNNLVSISNVKNKVIFAAPFTENLTKILKKVLRLTLKKISNYEVHPPTMPKGELSSNLVVDLYSTRPKYTIEGEIYSWSTKLILLRYNLDYEYNVLIDKANIIPINEEVDIISFNNISKFESFSLIDELKRDNIKTITYIYPDKFKEFQLKEFNKNSMRYFPRSIGLAFDFQFSEDFNLVENDFILAVDLIENNITFTLVKAKFSSNNKQIIWERYPTSSYEDDRYIARVKSALEECGCPNSDLLLHKIEVSTLIEEMDNLSFDFGYKYFHITREICDKINSIEKINIDRYIKDYIIEKQTQINNSNVVVLSNTNIFENLNTSYNYFNGYQNYINESQKSQQALWSDYVPSLYLKRLDKNFVLCNGGDITVVWGVKQVIELDSEFILSAGNGKYEFPLLEEDEVIPTNKAVLTSNAFPLKENIACKLTMIYEYGAIEPYVLLFNAVDKHNAGFSQIKAQWQPITSYECDNMASPVFPEQPSWELLRHYPKKNGYDFNDLLDWTARVLNEIKSYERSYVNLSKYDIEWEITTNSLGREYRFFTIDLNNENIIFREDSFNKFVLQDILDEKRRAIYFSKQTSIYHNNSLLATNIKFEDEKTIQFKKSLFAFHTVFFNGRIIDDNAPLFFRRSIVECFYVLIDRLNQKIGQEQASLYFQIIGLISPNFPDESYDVVSQHLDKNARDVINAGLFLGDLTTPEQKEVLKYLVDKYNSNQDINSKLIPAISNALWKNEKLIFNLNIEFLLNLLNHSIKYVCRKSNNIEQLKREKNFFKQRLLGYHLEFIFALLRLRELNDSNLNFKLSMNNKDIRELVTAIESFKQHKIIIKYKVEIETKVSGTNILVYTLLKYIYDDTSNESFIIKAPTE